ncbi:MAG: DUF302 domain-containing protein [Acidobacteriota bacterium]
MVSEEIAFEVQGDTGFSEAVERTVEALKAEGFGILTRIDVHEALKEKIDVDFRPYTILGACNPPLAHRALSAVPEVGLMLPCNVTVEDRPGGGSIVRIANPDQMMRTGGFEDDERIASVAQEAHDRLRRVADALEL